MCINSEYFLVQKKIVGEKIKNSHNHLKCQEKSILGIFIKMHNMHILCIIMHIFNFLIFLRPTPTTSKKN